MRKIRLIGLLVVALLLVVLPINDSLAEINHQVGSIDPRAEDLLERMTSEERVGQLFLVTFNGTEVGEETQIYDLIKNHHIGGVILKADNDNFTSEPQTLDNIWVMTNQLQTNKYLGSQEDFVNPVTGETYQPVYLPLFIGISQEGDGFPNDQILNGVTPLPSQMAIGATWNPDIAEEVGNVLGSELEALGFNLLLGPSLDVMENPQPEGNTDLGVRTFGGDPYWVGEMGRAYIKGVHIGSENRIAVVGKHFPGLGSSDRFPEDEVATVRKSLEQLKQIELAPFFAITGEATSSDETVDALLTSHIRYQGLQGNIRATTRPISFDPQAFDPLMNLNPFSSWRDEGGVMISDDLGSRAVIRLYDPTEEIFNARLPARDAFLAGNDLLYLGSDFIDSQDLDSYTTVLNTLEFFAQKYHEDQAFAQRVDESVLRIISLKFKLYDIFSLDEVLATGNDLSEIGQSEHITFEVARQGATLISPALDELDGVLPDIPDLNDRIVFITDTYLVRQCSECPQKPIIPINALDQAILDLYGPNAGGQVLPYNLVSRSFNEIEAMLDGQAGSGQVESDLRRANWIVFVMLDVDNNRPTSLTLRRFLFDRPDMSRQKRVVAFAANAPYYLDATDISKLDVYYGLYSKSQPFMDVAARLLFKEIPAPRGALPVSVTGVGYDLISATSPDPDRLFPIEFNLPEDELPISPNTLEPTPTKQFELGEMIPIRTGAILDHNGHPVPDNTPVQFIVSVNGEEILLPSAETFQGVARTSFLLEHTGLIEIRAVSEPAHSEVLTIDVPGRDTRTVEPTDTPSASETPSPTLTPTPPTPTPTSTETPPQQHNQTDIADWSLAIIAVGLVGWGAYRAGAMVGQVRWGMQWGLSAVIGGLLVYIYLSLEFPGGPWVMEKAGRLGIVLATFIGSGLGWGFTALLINGKSNQKDLPSNRNQGV